MKSSFICELEKKQETAKTADTGSKKKTVDSKPEQKKVSPDKPASKKTPRPQDSGNLLLISDYLTFYV